MTSYADTGFLFKLYVIEPLTPQAVAIMPTVAVPILVSALTVLEVRNALHLAVFQHRVPEATRSRAWQAFERDVSDGLYEILDLEEGELFKRAGELAEKYSARYGCRSLDLLHVAAALLAGAGELLSFDVRQRNVAAAEGLMLRP